MSDQNVNREYKDTLFRLIFKQKEHALALYNAVNKTDYTDIDDLEVITLEDAMYINIRDDVGYIFHDILSIFEQQASYNPNMPFRGLGYIDDSLREYVSKVYGNSVVYSEKIMHIPTPRYYVLYNGSRKQPEEKILRLSDAYDGEGDVEVTAHMLNINKGHNRDLLMACKPLEEYSELVYRVRSLREQGYANEDAVKMAIDSCLEEGILAEILGKERARVENIFIKGITEEEYRQVLERDKQIDIKEAEEKTRLEERIDTIDGLVARKGFSLEEACEFRGMSVEEYHKAKEKLAEKAAESTEQ